MHLTHPEFGYVGTSNLRRGFISFVICGLVAGGSGIAIFKGNPDPDPDPMKAMALAPAETLSSTAGSTIAGIVGANSGELAQEMAAIKPRCRDNATEQLGGDCITGQMRRPRSIRALNERPAIAAAPIGHLDGPPVLPSGSAVPAAVTPNNETTADSAGPADVPSAIDTAPAVTEAHAHAVSAKKTRTRSVQRRDRNDYSRSTRYTNRHYQPNYNTYYQSGYARLW